MVASGTSIIVRWAASSPAQSPEYWLPKLARNKERDLTTQRALEELGWSVLVVWECETYNDFGPRKAAARVPPLTVPFVTN